MPTVSVTPTAQSAQVQAKPGSDPIGAYLAAVDICRQNGAGSSACAKAIGLRAAALAAGLDPTIANAAAACVEAGDVEGCAKAAAAAGVTAACIAATTAGSAGSLAPMCGPLASFVVSLVWPVLMDITSAVAEVAVSLVSVGLEAIGLKDTPHFGDAAIPMRDAVVAQIDPAVEQAANAIADAIHKSRVAIGMKDNGVILVDGKFMWLDAAASYVIWQILSYDINFNSMMAKKSEYGSVELLATPYSVPTNNERDMEASMSLVSLQPKWNVHWNAAWKRDNAFQWAADVLAGFYASRLQGLHDSLAEAMNSMIRWEAQNPQTVEAANRAAVQQLAESGTIKFTNRHASGTGGALIAVGVLAALGLGGYFAWKKYGQPPRHNPTRRLLRM